MWDKLKGMIAGQPHPDPVLPEIKPKFPRLVRNGVICGVYNVKGTNPKTGRRKTETVYAPLPTPAAQIGKLSGLQPPYEVAPVPPVAPSDAQLKYAADLGAGIPKDATRQDLSYIISCALGEEDPDVHPADDRLIRYVIDRGIYVPPYTGRNNLTRLYLDGVPLKERIIYFCLRVYCSEFGKKYRIIPEAPKDVLRVCWYFAEAHLKDTDFLRSLMHYTEFDLPLDRCNKLKVLKAYEIAADYLKEHRV